MVNIINIATIANTANPNFENFFLGHFSLLLWLFHKHFY